MIFTIKMHLKRFLLQKFVRNDFYNENAFKNNFYDKNTLEMIFTMKMYEKWLLIWKYL